LLLWKHLLILKVVPKAASDFCSGFALIGRFILVYIHSQLSEQFSESQAGFGTTFKGTGCTQKAGTSSLKRVTGLQLVNDFIEASRKFILDFLRKKTTENCETLALIQKVLFQILGP
jgi:hypothetical protein